ncbi:xanthine dehydrogenase family protein molybdopterin-binding subunit [Bordetella genomosp. 13]|uniref:xanthine dehydrogenase family protein molybdopterin-binding subunit n=1 Tax=Bordetella genomosp. 13 TaxID=463040 RepID=UPI00119CEEDD|nr:molybdopterin cofactor-binding domain-containing protein [Bordetella genomosp. 13]
MPPGHPTTAAVAQELPPSLRNNPRLGAWLRIRPAGYAEAYSGKVELGQGILNALAQIVAEELDLDLAQVRMAPARTGVSPDEAVTSGSLSVQHSGAALRHVCALARALYLSKAAASHGVPVGQLRVREGVVLHGDTALTSYWELADDALLDCDAQPGATPKPRADYRVIGRSPPRPDIADKVHGEFPFIHDLAPEGLVHGRIVRPPSPWAVLAGWQPDDVSAWPGVLCVVRDGSWAGVVADTEALAERAAAQLAKQARWTEPRALPDQDDLPAWLKTLPRTTMELGEPAPPQAGARTLRAAYSRPFIRHGSIGPSCALALWRDEAVQVWSHTQSIYNLRKDLGLALRMPETDIVVQHVQGAGCYGHNGADDVAFDAAWLARHCKGRTVRVQWSRHDELCWSPVGPAMAVELEADVDEAGGVLAWRHESWSPGHGLRPGRGATPTLLGSWYVDPPFERVAASDVPRAAGGGGDRNADPLYAFPRMHVQCHRVVDVPMRTSSLRALGAYANVYAIESFMDELALAAGQDPLAYRLKHLRDSRAIAVLQAAAAQAGWQARVEPAGQGHGRGIGFARYKNTSAYCAVVAEVEVQEKVRVRRLDIAVDVGLAISPDGVRQQIEGGAIQAVSWALMEAAHFDRTRMLDDNWDQYPILRFSDVPEIDVAVLPADEYPSLGAGEASLGPTAAALGNAVFDALGVRVRDLPLSFDRIVQAMEG